MATLFLSLKDSKCIVVEQPGLQGNGRRSPQSATTADSAVVKAGAVARSLSSPGENSPDRTWETSESTTNSKQT